MHFTIVGGTAQRHRGLQYRVSKRFRGAAGGKPSNLPLAGHLVVLPRSLRGYQNVNLGIVISLLPLQNR